MPMLISAKARRCGLNLIAGAALLAGGAVIPLTASYAQSGDIYNRMDRLEREIDTLSRALFKGETPPEPGQGGQRQMSRQAGDQAQKDRRYRANLEVRLSQLESEIRKLTGRLEQHSHKIRQIESRLDRAFPDIDMRLNDLEKILGNNPALSGGGNARGNIGEDPTQPDDSAAPGGDPGDTPEIGNIPGREGSGTIKTLGRLSRNGQTEQETKGSSGPSALYDRAFALLRENDYAAAEEEFKEFLREYPDHNLASNATYWLGESYYVRDMYEQAARSFAKGYQDFPQGQKAPDNLLKLGMALAGMGNTEDACIALKQLRTKYSDGASGIVQRARREMKDIGCN